MRSSFSSKFNRREPKKKQIKKQGDFFKKAKSALFDGFFQGSDFYKVEKFVYLREAKNYEEKAVKNLSEGNVNKAIEEYKIASQLLKKSCEEGDPELAYYTSKIADVYLGCGQTNLAVEYYDQSLQQLLNSFLLKHEPIFVCYHQLAKCLIKQNEFGEAIYCIKECLQRVGKVESEEVAQDLRISCYKMLAEIYLKYEKYDRALENIEKISKEDVKNSEFVLDYGLCLACNKGDYNKGMKIIQKFMEKEREKFGENSFMVGIGGLYMGKFHMIKGEIYQAEREIDHSEQIIKELLGEENKFIGKCELMKGEIALKEGEYQKGMKNLMRGLEIFEEKDFELGRCYLNIGEIYMRMKKWDLAVENLKRGIEEREKLLDGFEEADGEFLLGNMMLAAVYGWKGDVKEVVVYYEKFMEELVKMVAEKCSKQPDFEAKQ